MRDKRTPKDVCGEARTSSVWLHIHCSTSIFGSEDNFQFTLKLIVESFRFHCNGTRRQASRPFELFPSQSLSSSRSSRCLCRSRKRQISQIKTNCCENHIHIFGISGPQHPPSRFSVKFCIFFKEFSRNS